MKKVIAVLVLLVGVIIAQPETCQQIPEAVPQFTYDANEVSWHLAGSLEVWTGSPERVHRWRIGRVCDPNAGDRSEVVVSSPFAASIKTLDLLTGGTVEGICVIEWTGNLPIGVTVGVLGIYDPVKGSRSTYNFLIKTGEDDAPFLIALPEGVEPYVGS